MRTGRKRRPAGPCLGIIPRASSSSRAPIPTWGRCWSGKVEETHYDRGASAEGTGDALTAAWTAEPAIGMHAFGTKAYEDR